VPEKVAWNRGCCRTTIGLLFSAVLPLDGRAHSQRWDYADVMPVGCDGDFPFACDFAHLKFNG
jgi:hypothetical protein